MPQEPRIENNGTLITPNQNVTVKTEDKAVLKCLSRHGNPPAILKWSIGKLKYFMIHYTFSQTILV